MLEAISIGATASAVFYGLAVIFGTLRLSFSDELLYREESVGPVLQAKVVNRMPWSYRQVSYRCFIIVPGSFERRVIIELPVLQPDQPLLGGGAFPRWRRRRYGWFGASHRLVSVFATISLDGGTQSRVEASSDDVLRIDELLLADAELVIVVSAVDGFLFGATRQNLRVYGEAPLRRGHFERGRSVHIVAAQHPDA